VTNGINYELIRSFARAIEPLAHFFACLEVWNAFLIDGDIGTGARVAGHAR